jgi:mevalonate pyrophosphate decarboxylase
MRNPNIRTASRNGNEVSIDSGSAIMLFCNEKGAKHYIDQRATAKQDRSFEIKTKTFEAKPETK